MRKITQTIVGTTSPLDKNVIWLDNTDSTAPVEKVFINGVWTPMGVDTDDYYTKEEVNDKLDEKLDVIENPVNGNLVAMDSQGQATNSGKKTTDFIATPTDSGSEGEVLSVDSEGNPVWTTVTPTGTADTEMSDTSTNAVQNKVIKGYVDNNFANKDGYYSTLTAGSAENLVGQTVDSKAYLIRPTGGAENEVANGVASVLGIEGNSCVWSQLVQNGDFGSGSLYWKTYNVSFSVDNRIAKITYDNALGYIGCEYASQISHKYYIKTRIKTDNPNTVVTIRGYDQVSVPTLYNDVVGTNFKKISCLTTSDKTTKDRVRFFVDNILDNLYIHECYIIDLTLLGIDNFTTVAEVEAWLAQHVGTKPYYAYNAGTILSAQTLGIKTYGQNLLNPTTKQAKLIPYTWEENSNVYTIKNVPSGATATFTPDNTGVAVTIDISSGSLDITSYGSGILELSATTVDTYVCIKWNGTKDDDVVPYEDHTYDFDVRKVYGKVSGAGEYVQCFQNGMRSAGSVHDELTTERAIVKQVLINLGDLSWSLGDSSVPNVFAAINNFNGKPFTLNALVTKGYKAVVADQWYRVEDKQMRIGNLNSNFGVIIHDNDYNSASSFQSAMEGVFMICELNTPITYTDLIYRDGGVDTPLADVLMNIEVNNWSMEEQLMTPYVDGNPTSIPATIMTQYGMDAVEAIDTLQKTCYFADDVRANLQALLTCINTNCAETLGGTFAISDTVTDKVFEFTFTPNAEPDVEPTNEGE